MDRKWRHRVGGPRHLMHADPPARKTLLQRGVVGEGEELLRRSRDPLKGWCLRGGR